MTLSTKIEVFLRILHLYAVSLHTCTAVVRSLCVSWAFLFDLVARCLLEGLLLRGQRLCVQLSAWQLKWGWPPLVRTTWICYRIWQLSGNSRGKNLVV